MPITDTPARPGGSAPGGQRSVAGRPGPAARAGHGYVNEVRWQGGRGRQPYANRGQEEAREPNLGDEFEGGDRGKHSGTTLEQMREARRKP